MVGNLTDPLTDSNCQRNVDDPTLKCNQAYSQQVQLEPITNKIEVNNISYVYLFDEKAKDPEKDRAALEDKEGRTDKAGKTKRLTFLKGKLAVSYLI